MGRGLDRNPPTYADGTLLKAPDNALYYYVGGELLKIDDAPRAARAADLLEAFGVLPTDVTAAELQVVPVGSMPRGTLDEYQEDEVVSDRPRRYMATEAHLSQESGRIDAKTRTWTRQPAIGFTGGVAILFVGANEQILGNTDVHQFGVDGFRIPFKQWKRQDDWSEAVDPGVAQATVRLVILHSHKPKSRILAILSESAQIGRAIGDVIAAIGAA